MSECSSSVADRASGHLNLTKWYRRLGTFPLSPNEVGKLSNSEQTIKSSSRLHHQTQPTGPIQVMPTPLTLTTSQRACLSGSEADLQTRGGLEPRDSECLSCP
ncbi:unnamed protein product [Protopolystoma xenopodis]|uniref:Uncharacterized protein n=1 Tax=Protopolystoma xenopodis TaxID=117903 RepID=A0A3S5AZP3_9PLAT|nr:unnamed protein product [Protopolystoma xenopodis]